MWGSSAPTPITLKEAKKGSKMITVENSGKSLPAEITVDGKDYVLVGTATKYKLIVKVFGAAMYFEKKSLKEAIDNDKEKFAAKKKAGKLAEWAVAQNLEYKMYLVLLREVSKSQLKTEFTNGLGSLLDAKTRDADLEKVFSMLPAKVVADSVVILGTTGDDIEVVVDGKSQGRADKAGRIVHAYKKLVLTTSDIYQMTENFEKQFPVALKY